MKKKQQKFLSLLLMLTMLFSMIPMASFAVAGTETSTDSYSVEQSTTPSAIAPSEATTPVPGSAAEDTPADVELSPQAETGGTLHFSKDLSAGAQGFLGYPNGGQWGMGDRLTVAVDTYTPVGGTSTAIPDGTSITYQWYSSDDETVDENDKPVSRSAYYPISTSVSGTKYFYAVVTATIDGVDYTGTSNIICVKVGAANKTVTLTVTDKGMFAVDKDGDPVCSRSISVPDLNYDNKVTYDEALQTAHKNCLTADGYAVSDAGWVTKFWGTDSPTCMFYLNGTAPNTAVTETEISGSDKLCAVLLKDTTYYSDYFTTFDLASVNVTENIPFELTLTDGANQPLSNIQIGIWKDGAFQPIEGKKTDASGKVSLTLADAGTYYVTASGTVKNTVTTDWSTGATAEHDCPIIPPGCTVTVKKLGELKFNGQFSDQPYSYTVGDTLTFPTLTARYYIDGNVDTSVTVTNSWYRKQADDPTAEPEKISRISSVLTSKDVGTWLYYREATCNANGTDLKLQSNLATVTISEPTPIVSSDRNGFVSDLTYTIDYYHSPHPSFQFEKGTTDYTVTALDNNASENFSLKVPAGKGLWWGIRIDGMKVNSNPDIEYSATNNESFFLPKDAFVPGETHIVTLLVGTKKDSNYDGTISARDNFEVYDAYNFHVTLLPSLSSLSVKDANGTEIEISPAFQNGSYYHTECSGNTNSTTVKLSAAFQGAKDVKLYLGDNSEPFTENLSDYEITLADYKDEGSEVASIPLKTVCKGADGATLERTFTLRLSSVQPPNIVKQPAAETAVEKGESVTLTVEAQAISGTTLSYQWMKGSSSSVVNTPIPGATSESYEVPGGTVADDTYYICRVTVTSAGGGSSYTDSHVAKVTTKLTYVDPPKITVQPGIIANDSGTGIYCTEYPAGSVFDPMYIGIATKSYPYTEYIDGNAYTKYRYSTEAGCDSAEVQLYYNSTPSLEGATPLDTTYTCPNSNLIELQTTTGLPEGVHYVCAVVTSRAADDPTKSASTTSDFVKLTYTKAEYGFAGSGSEDDPYLLKTPEDFVTIQQAVNSGETTFLGSYFRMENDITLPADWISIGSDGANGKFFGGTLDGNNNKLSYSKGSQSLFQYVSRGTIKNLKLYGEEIQGCGLIDNYWLDYNIGSTIDNVTLVSGTSTLRSGLIRGAFSGGNPSYITNCHAEKGVVIGYDKNEQGIGTFAGGFVGKIENCTSEATVYGAACVGGIVGSKSNSLGLFTIKNCSFTGTIEASGSTVGGIAAAGYNSNSAPNATCAVIENCYVNANITGKSEVGGIYGGEGGVDQCWENGIGYLRNNLFYGTLTATSPSGTTGGIIGYMRSLNRYNVIENNYYYDTNGCDKAIGGVEHIDTSAKPFGTSDGIFYYDTSRDSLDDIKDVVDAEDKGTADWQYTSVIKTDQNRTDDPMGQDMPKLGKACTAEEMKGGEVLALLNGHAASLKNWVQGEASPMLGTDAVVTALTVSGSYKTEYYIGEALDLSGAVFTATYSDGTEKEIPAADVTVTGFDSSQRAVLTLVASYGASQAEFEVRVIKKPVSGGGSIKVYFTLLGDDKHGDPTAETGTHTLKDKNLTTWIKKTTYTVDENSTVWDLLQAVEKDQDVTFSNPGGNYVDKVTFNGVTIGEFDNGSNSGWMYTLNNKHPLLSINQQFLENGDRIVFHYTDDYTVEEGSEPWEEENHPNGSGSPAAEQPVADETQAATGLPFTDVKATDYFCDAVKWAVEQGITSGTSKTAFSPKADCTRAQMVTFLWRAAGSPQPSGKAVPFTDVKADAYYLTALQWAIENNITSGTSATTFSPDAVCTRGQMAVFLWRAANSPEVEGANPFADVEGGDYFYTATLWAAQEGITSGTSDTAFSPGANCTRGQMITFLYRSYAKDEETAGAQNETKTDAADDAAK